MDESVRISRELVGRRRALSLGGTLSLGALLAACSDAASSTAGTASSAAAGPASSAAAGTASSAAAGTASSAAHQVIQAAPAGADLLAALDGARTCTPAKTETAGPYWFDVDYVRTDLREGRPGTPLQLAIRVQDTSACGSGGAARPARNCVVELWHCDAGGVYSGFEAASQGQGGPAGGPAPAGGPPPNGGGPPPGGPGGGQGGALSHGSYSSGEAQSATGDPAVFLRGAQAVDEHGVAQFTTIYPGWYRGRTVHIHVKVHRLGKTLLTSQLFADDAVSDTVYRVAPYSSRPGRDTLNTSDSIFDPSGVMTVRPAGSGYLGLINLGIAG